MTGSASEPSAAAIRAGITGAACLLAILQPMGCAGPHQPGFRAADSTGTVVGHLFNSFVHGPAPFYGAVVYLIPVSPSTEDWWVRLARPRHGLVDPAYDKSVGYDDRTTCDPQGRFRFAQVRPGAYYLYSRVLWTSVMNDSTLFGGADWVAEVRAAPRETVWAGLRSSQSYFQSRPPRRRFMRPDSPTDSSLPRWGEYVSVDELPEPTSRVPAVYEAALRRAGIGGTVLIAALVGEDGTVKDTRIVRSVPRLDEAAEAAVRRWTFKPARRNGRPVAFWTSVPVRFEP